MMKFRATSTRVTDGHQSNCFTNFLDRAQAWAEREAKDGFCATVYEVVEVPVTVIQPPPPPEKTVEEPDAPHT